MQPQVTSSKLPASVAALAARKQPQLWINPNWMPLHQASSKLQAGLEDLNEAADNWRRLAGLLQSLFPELEQTHGIIESRLQPADSLRRDLMGDDARAGRWLLKCDHALPIAGSIKARGGIYEVLLHAWDLACREGVLRADDDLQLLGSAAAREFFSRHEVAVGSTGNLGLSVGVMAAALGFRSTVHMSAQAKEWKKARLRTRGVNVVEHDGDFAAAVAAGRDQAADNPRSYFVDDEQSRQLFLGYSVAAIRLKEQLCAMRLPVDDAHPLFVYLPCGVGGAPGGITFGLRHVFGDNVHCFLAEPVASACMLLRLASLVDVPISVRDVGLDNCTDADGLAVPQASEFAAAMLKPLASGVFTELDSSFWIDLFRLANSESIQVEPSAAAGLRGPEWILNSDCGRDYLARRGLDERMSAATHILWTTGGEFVPPDEHRRFYERGRCEFERGSAIGHCSSAQ